MQGVVLEDVAPPWVRKPRKRFRVAAAAQWFGRAWPARWRRELPSWVLSLAVHVVLLVTFALLSAGMDRQTEAIVLDSRLSDLPEDRVALEDVDTGFTAAADDAGEGVAGFSATIGMSTPDVPDLTERIPEAQLVAPERFEPIEAPQFNANFSVKGISAVRTSGVEGAVDRLTIEILRSLEQNETLVAWLFDASESLQKQRETIAKRFDRVYAELGQSERSRDRALISGVVAFGKDVDFLTEEPTDDVETLKAAVRGVKIDEDGIENVFTAVAQTAGRWLKYRRREKRNFMVIVFTDEVGDDWKVRMEPTLDLTRRNGISVYVVGIPALFGREKEFIPWRDPNGGMHQIPVDQGPETLYPERINIPFWGGGGQELERFGSGFGPFALTRLCRETGGIYFIAREGRGPQFDPLELKSYQPDYLSAREYDQLLRSNRARAAVVQAAQVDRTNVVVPRTVFPAVDDAALRRTLDGAQRAVALLENRLRPMIDVLSQGEADRTKLRSPRWRADFDLAVGRALANFVRAREYNSVLAQMKQGRKFDDPKNNHWRLKPDEQISGGTRLEKMAKQAKQSLQRVIDEHPHTPWSLIAEQELSQPFGWHWEEFYVPVAPRADAQVAAAQRQNTGPNRPAAKPKPFKVPKY
jgi:hypothetical protein